MSVGDTPTRTGEARAGSQPSRPWLPAAMLVTAPAPPGDAGRGQRVEPATGNLSGGETAGVRWSVFGPFLFGNTSTATDGPIYPPNEDVKPRTTT